MDTRFRTSFVPKKALAVQTVGAKGGTINLFFALGTILFVLALVGSGGVYLYKVLLEKSIDEKSIALEKAKKAFEPSFIEVAKRFDSRLDAARQVLSQHTSATPVFNFLSANTLRTIRFTDFAYSYGEGNPTIALKGEAKGKDSAAGYASIALQSDVFLENDDVVDPVFSGLKLSGTDAGVVFSFTGGLPASFVGYANALSAAPPFSEEALGREIFPEEAGISSGFPESGNIAPEQ